jgi:exopolysaccharide production protein ExoQ
VVAVVRDRYWPVVSVLGLVVASDYKFRLRPDTDTINGHADPFVILEIGVYAVVALFLAARFRPSVRRLRRSDLGTYLGYAYVVVCAGSALYSPYLDLGLVRAAQLIVVLALARSIARHADAAAPHRIAHAYAVLIAASVLFGVLFRYPELPSQPGRFTWLYVHPVQAGMMLAIAVIVLTTYLVGTRIRRNGPVWHPAVYGVLWLICTGGLLATQTRGAVAGAVVGVVVVVLTRFRGIRRLEVVLVSCVGLAAVALVFSPEISAFFARGETTAQLETLNFRTDLWKQALEAVLQHPLYGYGLGASRGLFLDSTGLGGGHNAVVNLLVDTGLLGTAVWLALLVVLGRTAFRIRTMRLRTDRALVLAVLCGMVVNTMFTEGLGAPANAMCTWLFVLLAWTAVLRREAVTVVPVDPDVIPVAAITAG